MSGGSLKYTDFEQVSMTADDRIRSDGGIDALDPPPADIMDEETLDPATLAQNAPRLETVVKLLNQPALARVYVYVCYWGPVSPPTSWTHSSCRNRRLTSMLTNWLTSASSIAITRHAPSS